MFKYLTFYFVVHDLINSKSNLSEFEKKLHLDIPCSFCFCFRNIIYVQYFTTQVSVWISIWPPSSQENLHVIPNQPTKKSVRGQNFKSFSGWFTRSFCATWLELDHFSIVFISNAFLLTNFPKNSKLAAVRRFPFENCFENVRNWWFLEVCDLYPIAKNGYQIPNRKTMLISNWIL